MYQLSRHSEGREATAVYYTDHKSKLNSLFRGRCRATIWAAQRRGSSRKRTPPGTLASAPHLAHPRSNIGTRVGSGRSRVVLDLWGPSPAFKKIEDGLRNEPAPRRKHVRVAVAMLLTSEKPKRLD